jgi:CheY-like chemotaxis protein
LYEYKNQNPLNLGEEAETPGSPVLVLSANPEAFDLIRCLAAGANGHLAKSAPADELVSALARALQATRSSVGTPWPCWPTITGPTPLARQLAA